MSASQGRLNDAAIALYEVLSGANVEHGIFGGYAVSTLGGHRASKDVDGVASVRLHSCIQSQLEAQMSKVTCTR